MFIISSILTLAQGSSNDIYDVVLHEIFAIY